MVPDGPLGKGDPLVLQLPCDFPRTDDRFLMSAEHLQDGKEHLVHRIGPKGRSIYALIITRTGGGKGRQRRIWFFKVPSQGGD